MSVGRGSPAIQVRLPEELKHWLKQQAVENRRTLNSEVLVRLEQSRERQEKIQQQEAVHGAKDHGYVEAPPPDWRL